MRPMGSFEEIYAGNPGHSGRRNAADWLATCLLVLDRAEGVRDRAAEARGIVENAYRGWTGTRWWQRAQQFPTEPVEAPGD